MNAFCHVHHHRREQGCEVNAGEKPSGEGHLLARSKQPCPIKAHSIKSYVETIVAGLL